MMTHERAQHLIDLRASEVLTKVQSAELDAHIDQCAACQAYALEHDRYELLLKTRLKQRHPRLARQNLTPVFERLEQPAPPSFRLPNYQSALGLVALFVIIVAAWSLRSNPDGFEASGQTEIEPQTGIVEIDVPVDAFTSINIGNNALIRLSIADETRITAKVRASQRDRIKAEVDLLGNLSLGATYIEGNPEPTIIYDVTTPRLTHIDGGGSATLEIESLDVQKLTIDLGGGATLKIDSLTAQILDVSASAGARVRIDGGQVEMQLIRISSDGDFDAPNMMSDSAEISMTNNSNLSLNVTDQLTITSERGGTITVTGAPTITQPDNNRATILYADPN